VPHDLDGHIVWQILASASIMRPVAGWRPSDVRPANQAGAAEAVPVKSDSASQWIPSVGLRASEAKVRGMPVWC